MARVNITVPDDLVAEAKARGWNISRMTTQALRDELERQRKIEELDRYLAQLDDELGPIPQEELDEAEAWARSDPGARSRYPSVRGDCLPER